MGVKYRVLKMQEFDSDFKKLQKNEKERVDRFLLQLSEKGGLVGKPLGVKFFREKKFEGKRLYYLIYDEVLVVLAVAISDKKAQRATINRIMPKFSYYQQYVSEALKQLKD